mmetsp:Transcript_15150/g.42985  ORF Transcript_15150/g.42985 Transcript_15150/m.42985 type:complete len:207 (-) Transcript_15150:890-1510(-)
MGSQLDEWPRESTPSTISWCSDSSTAGTTLCASAQQCFRPALAWTSPASCEPTAPPQPRATSKRRSVSTGYRTSARPKPPSRSSSQRSCGGFATTSGCTTSSRSRTSSPRATNLPRRRSLPRFGAAWTMATSSSLTTMAAGAWPMLWRWSCSNFSTPFRSRSSHLRSFRGWTSIVSQWTPGADASWTSYHRSRTMCLFMSSRSCVR